MSGTTFARIISRQNDGTLHADVVQMDEHYALLGVPSDYRGVTRVELYLPNEAQPFFAVNCNPQPHHDVSRVELTGDSLHLYLYVFCWPYADTPAADQGNLLSFFIQRAPAFAPQGNALQAWDLLISSLLLADRPPGLPQKPGKVYPLQNVCGSTPSPNYGSISGETSEYARKGLTAVYPKLAEDSPPYYGPRFLPVKRDGMTRAVLLGFFNQLESAKWDTGLGQLQFDKPDSPWLECVPTLDMLEPLSTTDVRWDPRSAFWILRIERMNQASAVLLWNEGIAEPYYKALRASGSTAPFTFIPTVRSLPKQCAVSVLLDPSEAAAGKNAPFPALHLFEIRSADTGWNIALPALRERNEAPTDLEFPVSITAGVMNTGATDGRLSPYDRRAPFLDVTLDAGTLAAASERTYRLGALDLTLENSGKPRWEIQAWLTGVRSGTLVALPALQQLAFRVSGLKLNSVTPGAEDPTPDGIQAQYALRPSADESDQAIAALLAEQPSIVIPGISFAGDAAAAPKVPAADELTLEVDEAVAPAQSRSLELHIFRQTNQASAPGRASNAQQNSLVYLSAQPFLVGRIDLPPLENAGTDFTEIGYWRLSDSEGSRWQLAAAGAGFDLVLPPQALGESMMKNARQSDDLASGQPIDFRFGAASRLRLQSSYFTQREAEAPWNLRRVLGYAGQRAPGALVDKMRFELAYGMTTTIDASLVPVRLQLAELGSRIGAPSAPIDRSLASAKGWYPDKDPRNVLFTRHRVRWAQAVSRYRSRLAILELYSPGEVTAVTDDGVRAATGSLVLDRGVSYHLRRSAGVRYPIDPERSQQPDLSNQPPHDPKGLHGGVTWPFESQSIYESLWRVPDSTGGRISKLYLSSLGGFGEQRALFDNNRTIINTVTVMGRLSKITVERIGRIGVLWNRAKHVIVYERSVLPSEQFESSQPRLAGWPLLRKVSEYVQLLERDRNYPDLGTTARLPRGCVEGNHFITVHIPVDGAWGRDIEGGFEIPLWNAKANQRLYPKPLMQLLMAGDKQGIADRSGSTMSEPQRLYFYSSTDPKLDDRTDLWPAVLGVDYTDEPRPQQEIGPALSANDPDGKLGDAAFEIPGWERLTFPLERGPLPANLVVERTGTPLSAHLANATMMRAASNVTGSAVIGTGVVKTRVLQQALGEIRQNILSAARESSGAIDSQARTAISNVVGQATDLLKAAKNTQDDALAFLKPQLGSLQQWSPCSKIANTFKPQLKDRVGAAQTLIQQWHDNVKAAILEIRDDAGPLSPGAAQDLAETWASQLRVLSGPLRTVADDFGSGIDSAIEMISTRAKDTREWFDNVTLALNDCVLSQSIAMQVLSSLIADATARLREAIDALPVQLPSAVQGVVSQARSQISALIASQLQGTLTQAVQSVMDGGDEWEGDVAAQLALVRSEIFGIPDPGINPPPPPKGLAAIIDTMSSARKALQEVTDAFLPAPGAGIVPGDFVAAVVNVFTARITQPISRSELLSRLENACDTATGYFSTVTNALDTGTQKITDTFCGDLFKWNLPGIDTNALEKLGTTLQDELDEFVNTNSAALHELVGKLDAALAPVVQELSDTYAGARAMLKDMGQLPSFHDASSVLRLVRAVGEGPLVEGLAFNRDQIGYYFDELNAAVQTSPIAAMANRLGDELKSFGLRVPSTALLDRVIPDGLQNYDLGKIFPDFAGLQNSELFKAIHLPDLSNDLVHVTHGADAANKRFWLKALVDTPLDAPGTVFSVGPLALVLDDASFYARSEVTTTIGGSSQSHAEGAITGDWDVSLGGSPLVSFVDTKLHFDETGKLDFQISADKIELAPALQWLSDIVEEFSSDDDGFTIELVEVDGIPVGVRCCLNLPMPPLASGVFAISGIVLGASLMVGIDPETREFSISLGFNVSQKTEPFTLTIAFLGGGGWLESQAHYLPSSGAITTRASIGIVAGAGVEFALGPVRGSVYVQFGIFVEFQTAPGQSQTLSIAIMLLVRGEVVVLSFISVSLVLLLQAVYRSDGSLTGYGSISITIKISMFFKIRVREQVTYPLKNGSGHANAAALAALAVAASVGQQQVAAVSREAALFY